MKELHSSSIKNISSENQKVSTGWYCYKAGNAFEHTCMVYVDSSNRDEISRQWNSKYFAVESAAIDVEIKERTNYLKRHKQHQI